jgi:cell division protein FtsI (penicillin-binding protein 3)
MKNELNSIFSQLNLPFVDSAIGGYWRTMQMKDNAAVFNLPESASAAALVIPSVVGMGLKDAVYLMENKGLKVMATGRGRVFSQSIEAGTSFIKGQTVTLFLN